MNPNSILALRRVHVSKRQKTAAQIDAALDRMSSGKVRLLVDGIEWTQRALAKEAEVHVNTLNLRGSNGARVFQGALDRLTNYGSSKKRQRDDLIDKRYQAQKAEKEMISNERDLLIAQLEKMTWSIIAEREKALKANLDLTAMRKRLVDAGLAV